MEERIVEFIAALRASGVRVSQAESIDAFSALDLIGVQDRDVFRLTMRATLIKEASQLPVFEELFPLFFDNPGAPTLLNLAEDFTPQQADLLANALRRFNQRLRKMLEKLLQGEQLNPQELERLARTTGLNQISDLRYLEWMARRMERALQLQTVRQALDELLETLAKLGMNHDRLEQMRRIAQANQDALREQVRRYAGRRIAENISRQSPQADISELLDRPFSRLSDRDMDRLRDEVRRLATILRSRAALRQKRAKTGQLDPKATIRANLKHANIPIDIKFRDRHLKPKLVVLCDISTSMRYCSELMLHLIYALQDQIRKTHAFAFIDHLEYISPDFVGKSPREAVTTVLHRMPPGYYSTDLGNSLVFFVKDFMETMDNRTTFIVVGDGRNNYNNPQIQLFRTLTRRSHRTLWLNPEMPSQWGTGDSDMLQYAPHCNSILRVSTLAELTAAIDRLLR